MSKKIQQFKEHYPHVLNENQMTGLKHVLESGAHANVDAAESKLEKIKAGEPVIINAGFTAHTVTLLIWGNQFVICNRGGASRRPIEVYHFDPLLLNPGILNAIDIVKRRPSNVYKELFFKELPKVLKFSQDTLDRQMEKAFYFPDQSVGNCSFVSPVTAVFAFMLMETARGMDEQGHLLPEVSGKDKIPREQIIKTVAAYQIWLSDLQLGFLEKNIDLLNGPYVPDHALIVAGLREAHLLPLDAYAAKRLEELTTLYIQALDQEAATKVKSDLLYWKSLHDLRNYSAGNYASFFARKVW